MTGSTAARRASRAMRPPVSQLVTAAAAPLNERGLSVLIVDLNNFATFPTLAVGLLCAALRSAGHEARVLSPLAYDVPAANRERRETWRDHLARRVHLSTWRPFRTVRDAARQVRERRTNRTHPTVLKETAKALDAGPDVLLLSAYLQHHRTVKALGRLAAKRGVPVLLGGPMFNVKGVSESWRTLPGITAVVGAESDLSLPDLVRAAAAGDDLLAFPGVTLPDGRASGVAPPLKHLDRTPVPDFTDFPWDRYPVRIIPMMTGRGCQWNRCVFCSDIISVNGRSFRTRSVESVLVEMREQAQRHGTTNFLFLDLKLNSQPAMLRGLAERAQDYVPGAQWIGTVHVDQRKDNGLSRPQLRAAVAGGMRRVSFGLETGSQRLLDAMDKGCTVERNSEFIRNAHEAGLSVRCTMFKGFPGETAQDLIETAEFLEEHAPYLDRVRFNEFAIPEDTPIYELLAADRGAAAGMRMGRFDHVHGRARGDNKGSGSRAYRKAKSRTLRAVYEINRREVRESAQAFDGLM